MSDPAIVSASHAVLTLPIGSVGELPAEQSVGMIDPAAVDCLAIRLEADGLRTPIWVRRNGNAAQKRYSVIAGRHRLLAAKKLGWLEIEAVEKAGPSSDTAELRRLQIVENLDRRDLRPIERAIFVMDRWREAAERIVQRAPTGRHGRASRARWDAWEVASHASAADRRAIDQLTGDECGKSDRWVRTYRAVYEAIVIGLPDLFEALNAHLLGASLSAVMRLATLNSTARRTGAEMILSRSDWVNIDAALVAAKVAISKGTRVDPDYPNDVRFFNGWAKMATPRKCSNFIRMADDIPAAFVRDVIDRLSEKLP